MSMSQRLRYGITGLLDVVVRAGRCVAGCGGLGCGLDEAEDEQPRRLAVFAGAVGFDEAAVLLDLALDLLQGGARMGVHLL
jgi:hypothetical protein